MEPHVSKLVKYDIPGPMGCIEILRLLLNVDLIWISGWLFDIIVQGIYPWALNMGSEYVAIVMEFIFHLPFDYGRYVRSTMITREVTDYPACL